MDPKDNCSWVTSTMDKTVAMTRHQTQDPLMRGYRVYYGEGVEPKFISEEDMEDAFGL